MVIPPGASGSPTIRCGTEGSDPAYPDADQWT